MANAGNLEGDEKFIGPQDKDGTQDEKEIKRTCSESELRFVIVGRTGSGISSLDKEKKLHDEDSRFGTEDEIRIVLIGRTGNGKSATGNSIMSQKGHFPSQINSQSITQVCRRGEVVREGKTVIVVDSPGLFDTGNMPEHVKNEMIKCISVSSPGPHAILYVLSCRNRFTKEEEDTFTEMIAIFGENLYKYIIFLFTALDDVYAESKTFEEFLKGCPAFFKRIFMKCANRVLAFNNRADKTENERQQNSLFAIIAQMNGGDPKSYYQHQMFQEAEKIIEQQMKKIYEETIKKGGHFDAIAIKAKIRSQIRDDILKDGELFHSIKKIIFNKYFCAAGLGVGALLLKSSAPCTVM